MKKHGVSRYEEFEVREPFREIHQLFKEHMKEHMIKEV
jgi:hypothetical protein